MAKRIEISALANFLYYDLVSDVIHTMFFHFMTLLPESKLLGQGNPRDPIHSKTRNAGRVLFSMYYIIS